LCHRASHADVQPVATRTETFGGTGLSDADNSRRTLAYQNMVDQLQSFADRITTPDIRAKADTVVAINRDMFDHWKRWLAESQSDSTVSGVPTDSDRLYVHEFTEEARKLKIVDAELEKACPA
jgi:hypothetical protein